MKYPSLNTSYRASKYLIFGLKEKEDPENKSVKLVSTFLKNTRQKENEDRYQSLLFTRPELLEFVHGRIEFGKFINHFPYEYCKLIRKIDIPTTKGPRPSGIVREEDLPYFLEWKMNRLQPQVEVYAPISSSTKMIKGSHGSLTNYVRNKLECWSIAHFRKLFHISIEDFKESLTKEPSFKIRSSNRQRRFFELDLYSIPTRPEWLFTLRRKDYGEFFLPRSIVKKHCPTTEFSISEESLQDEWLKKEWEENNTGEEYARKKLSC